MNNRKVIQQELNEWNLKVISAIQEPVFSLPDSYFENFPSTVLSKIKDEIAVPTGEELIISSPIFSRLSRQMPFEVPQNYFSNFVYITTELTENHLQETMGGLNKIQPYTLPSGYFNDFPEKMLARVSSAPAKIIPIHSRNWFRIAVAAIVAGIISISGFLYFNDSQNNSIGTTTSLAHNLNEVPDKELEDFISTADAGNEDDIIETSTTVTNINALLQDIPDHELDAFLEQVPDDEEL